MTADGSKTIAAFPLETSSYTRLFYASLERCGYRVVAGNFYGRWLLKNLSRIDYCHFHWPSFLYHDKRGSLFIRLVKFARFVALMFLIRLSGVRILWTAHNLYPHDGGKELRLHRAARHLMIWLSDAIFVHGPTALEIFAAEFPKARSKLWPILHGHFADYYPNNTNSTDARRKLGLRPERFVYLFFGICKEYKNLEMLVEAFGKTDSDCDLVISGKFQSPDYYAKIRATAGPLGDRVIFHPHFIPDEELQDHFAACDVVVLPYKEVLTSGTVILAMSFRKPVIAAGKGSIVDVVPADAGILFSPNTADELANALVQARTARFDPERIASHVRSLDWERSAEAFARALSEGRSRSHG